MSVGLKIFSSLEAELPLLSPPQELVSNVPEHREHSNSEQLQGHDVHFLFLMGLR